MRRWTPSPFHQAMGDRRRQWRTTALTVLLGGALLAAGFLLRSFGFFENILINIGTSVFLVPVILIMEDRLERRISDLASDRLVATPPEIVAPEVELHASDERQEQLQRNHPLSSDVCVEIAEAFGVPEPEMFRITFPIPESEHRDLHHRELALSAHIDMVQRQQARNPRPSGSSALSDRQTRALAAFYDYLRGADSIASKEQLERSDVILVTGARGPTVNQRVERALEIADWCREPPTLIFSGGYASYDAVNPGYSEAKALAEIAREHDLGKHLLDRGGGFLMEERSRSLAQNIQLSAPLLQALAWQRSRALTVTVITAPYALRRLALIADVYWSSKYVHNVLPAHGPNNWSLERVLALAEKVSDQGDATPSFEGGIRRWMNDFFKLLGGRAAGEF